MATVEHAAQLKRTHGIDFRIRAGINTGPVIVGNVLVELRQTEDRRAKLRASPLLLDERGITREADELRAELAADAAS